MYRVIQLSTVILDIIRIDLYPTASRHLPLSYAVVIPGCVIFVWLVISLRNTNLCLPHFLHGREKSLVRHVQIHEQPRILLLERVGRLDSLVTLQFVLHVVHPIQQHLLATEQAIDRGQKATLLVLALTDGHHFHRIVVRVFAALQLRGHQ